ncbi:MAG: glycoside hydrolase family 2 TIM barrel-domain containing protein [Siphonobacter sp.]
MTTRAIGQASVKTQIQYLSGPDVTHPKTWDFFCTGGRKASYWTKIEVPSHWEQQGFGRYNYGRDDVTYGKNFRYADEKGLYKHSFTVPAGWKDKDIYLVFEGSMTDTDVKINGKSAGPVHQGSFYRFKYNVSDKITFGQPNLIEVSVSKMSSEPSVNQAERLADFWIFGGIYRPVYLEALPKEHIDWLSIDAKADGSFNLAVNLNQAKAGRAVVAQIVDGKGTVLVTTSKPVVGGDSVVQLKTTLTKPLLWSAETPHLYSVKVFLKQADRTLHETADQFGFRTLEVRRQDGVYLNGTKIKLKGVNRHVFWPEYGRATYPQADRLDVTLIKEMNMNAVRCSHYPPDPYFLHLCDSLGLYVIDELTGWQKAYTTKAGTPLVKEMVIRDTNHPSIIFWSNGNEGGHNKDLDDDFGQYDLSKRTVIHAHHKPGNAINGIDCNHYEDYYSSQKILADTNLYMPTEFLHAMNDGGGAAALSDIWELHWNAKKGVGGFIWNFADEGIMRTDEGNRLDVNGLNGADGVVGPHREKEGSFQAIREIYSPVKITLKTLPADFSGAIPVENRYHFTNLNHCTFGWELIRYSKWQEAASGHRIVQRGSASAPDIAPTAKGELRLTLPPDWHRNDALVLKAYDSGKHELYRWVWPVKSNEQLLEEVVSKAAVSSVSVTENDSLLALEAAGITVSISKRTGQLASLANENSAKLSFRNGPVLVSGRSVFTGLRHFKEGESHVVEATYQGDLTQVRWTMHPSGWLEMTYRYSLDGNYPFAGITFSYPENLVLGATWLGKGPSHVWKNRLQGVTLDVYRNRNNDAQAGHAPWEYPEFKGYFSDIVWMEFNTLEGKFTIASPEPGLFVRLFDFYAIRGAKPHPDLPPGDISFLDCIPATGSKLGISPANVQALGPNSALNAINSPIQRTLYFYFGSPKPTTE